MDFKLFAKSVLVCLLIILAGCSTKQLEVDSRPYLYTLDTGDVLRLAISGEANELQITVGESGLINFDQLTNISVRDKTVQQLQAFITQQLVQQQLYNNPVVQVSIEQYRPFYIDGAVNNPGSFEYEPGLTVSKAISIAGGLSERGDNDKVTITRMINGTQQELKAGSSMRIRPGDIIKVIESIW
jgi:polysaccharide export outer membrane protein